MQYSLYFLATISTLLMGITSCSQSVAEAEESIPKFNSERYTLTQGSYELKIHSDSPPRSENFTVGENTLQFELLEDGEAVDDLNVEVDNYMSAHGHGSNSETTTEFREGLYLSQGLIFTMPGTWEVFIIIDSDTLTFSAEVLSQQ